MAIRFHNGKPGDDMQLAEVSRPEGLQLVIDIADWLINLAFDLAIFLAAVKYLTS